MKKLLFAALLLSPSLATAQGVDYYESTRDVIRSSATIPLILVSSHTPTLVDTPQMEGSFITEIQNRDGSAAICCAFDVNMSTVTTSARGKSCRQVAANGGTWVVKRWWQNLRLYCQTLSTSGTSPVVVTQGR